MSPRTPPAAARRRVVVIDDDEVMLLSCSEILGRVGYSVETFDNGTRGLQRIAEAPAPLLLVDLKMPELDGMEVMKRAAVLDPSIVIVVITGFATISTAVDAMRAGAYDFLPKPFTPQELTLIVERAYERWQLATEASRLQREKEEAQRRFITFVSHQLKTPLVAVKQYLDVLSYGEQAELSPRAREWIQRSQGRLIEVMEIIDDWLELSRIEHGELCAHGARCELVAIARHVVSALQTEAERAKVGLTLDFSTSSLWVCGERMMLTTLLTNLLDNGIKYNRPGGLVTLRSSVVEGAILIEVTDTGIGIPAAALAHVFEEFYRVKSEATASLRGSGLGLAICRRIATELGGSIDVESDEGRGSTFRVRLPAAPLKEGVTAAGEDAERGAR